MHNIKQIFLICRNNIQRSFINPRTYISFLLVLVLMQQLTQTLRKFSSAMGVKTAPWIYPYLAQKYYIQMILILGIVFLFCDAPFMNESTPFLLIRSGRRNWILGQITYIIIMSFLYYTVIVMMSVLLLYPQVQWQMGWGKILGTLAQTNAASQIGISELLLDYRMQITYTPIAAMGYSFIISWLVGVITGLLMLVLNFCFKYIIGQMVGAAIAFLPYFAINFSSLYDIYYVSPASWMNIMIWTGDRTSKLPTKVYMSLFIGVTILALILIALVKTKKCTIDVVRQNG